jgi:hypothetical protein
MAFVGSVLVQISEKKPYKSMILTRTTELNQHQNYACEKITLLAGCSPA